MGDCYGFFFGFEICFCLFCEWFFEEGVVFDLGCCDGIFFLIFWCIDWYFGVDVDFYVFVRVWLFYGLDVF